MNNTAISNDRAAISHRFKKWLVGGHFECISAGYHLSMLRIQKSDVFDYLYCKHNYHATSIERGGQFEYAGIYYKADGLVYDVSYDIRGLMSEDDDYETRSKEALARRLKFHVCRAVEKMVSNDRSNLTIAELHSEREIRDMEHFKKYTAAGKARGAFLESDSSSDDGFSFSYECRYRPDNWTEESLLLYIADPNGYADKEATAYFEANQEEILSDFLMSDMVAEEYNILVSNPSLPVHRVKRIMQAMNQSSAKTITVTVRINGIEFTFKTDASEFRRDCTSHYSDWNIVAADRREYERVFGRGVRFGAEDITRIEYARSVLYSADVVQSDSESGSNSEGSDYAEVSGEENALSCISNHFKSDVT